VLKTAVGRSGGGCAAERNGTFLKYRGKKTFKKSNFMFSVLSKRELEISISNFWKLSSGVVSSKQITERNTKLSLTEY